VACQTFGKKPLFSREDMAHAAKDNRLLSMEIEFSRRCNFNCPYCYHVPESDLNRELTPDESRDAILQARDLGARRIIILGGEPMIYPQIMEMIEFITDHGMAVEVFTNGSCISAERARELAVRDVKVVLKMNTRDEALQNRMAGHPEAQQIISEAFENLKAAGYGPGGKPMAVSTVISEENIEELPEFWCWLRDQDIDPYFEMITPQGSAVENEWLYNDMERLKTLFHEIAGIDKERYGHNWIPQPPLVGDCCLRHLFSCVVTANGDIWPCVGIDIPVGNIRNEKLAAIIKDSEVIQDLRGYKETIKGPCATCDSRELCYGCRGAAYQLTGDYLASDPFCWLNSKRLDEIEHLPVPVEMYIPQRSPMRMVDTLLAIGERHAKVETILDEINPFLDKSGVLESAAYMEIIAQAAAALNGFQLRNRSEKPSGFLMGARNITIHEPARCGDRLVTSVHKEHKFEGFGIIRGRVERNGQCLAEGEIKVFHKSS